MSTDYAIFRAMLDSANAEYEVEGTDDSLCVIVHPKLYGEVMVFRFSYGELKEVL